MDNYFDHLDDYIEERLSTEDRAVFESEIEVNEELAFAVKEYQLLQGAQDVLVEDDIQASIDEVRAELNQDKNESQQGQSNNRSWLRPVGIAASVVLLLGIGYMIMQGLNQTVSGDTIYAMSEAALLEKYFREPVDSTERGSNETVDDTEINAPQKPCEIAHHLMANEKYKEALETFSYSLNDSDQNCKWKSEFYSSLIYAIQGDTRQAKTILEKIVSDVDHGFNAKANRLLVDLK